MAQDEKKASPPPAGDAPYWVSTYGIMTAERVLERYQLKIPIHDLKRALNYPGNFIHHLLSLPLKNVFNGIIMQQAKDYMIFSQKLFVDYLLSGETTREASSPGEGTREALEALRKKLVAHSETFQQIGAQQIRLIYDTQHLLIDRMKRWGQQFDMSLKKLKTGLERQGLRTVTSAKLSQCLLSLLVYKESEINHLDDICWREIAKILGQPPADSWIQLFQQTLAPLNKFDDKTESALQDLKDRAQSMHVIFMQYRRDFYEYISRSNSLLDNLPEYRLSAMQLEKNRQEILFDPNFDIESSA